MDRATAELLDVSFHKPARDTTLFVKPNVTTNLVITMDRSSISKDAIPRKPLPLLKSNFKGAIHT
jgi:hypothetical protein